MPLILSLQTTCFRNLSSIHIEPAPHINIFLGHNGAGKTSLLESIFYASTGRSFRTQHGQQLIQEDTDALSICLTLSQYDTSFPLGVTRHRSGMKQLRVHAQSVDRWSELAHHLPISLLSHANQRFLSHGPSIRRAFLDWLLFHVEPSFLGWWQQSQRALKQRNAALKSGYPNADLHYWNESLSSSAEAIDRMRSHILAAWQPCFLELCQTFLPQYAFTLYYHRGWPASTSLTEALEKSWNRDCQLGYTQMGPHRANLDICVNSIPAQARLSQGQQKLLAHALYLSQGIFLTQHNRQQAIYLVDDLADTLDQQAQKNLLAQLISLNNQIFMTAIHAASLPKILADCHTKMFHVEQGKIYEA